MADVQISALSSLATPAAADFLAADKADGSATGKVTFAQAVSAAGISVSVPAASGTLSGNVTLTRATHNGTTAYYNPGGATRTVTLWALPQLGDNFKAKNIGTTAGQLLNPLANGGADIAAGDADAGAGFYVEYDGSNWQAW